MQRQLVFLHFGDSKHEITLFTLEGMGEFWDSHDFTEFDTDAPDVEFDISISVPVEPDLLAEVEKQARLRGISVETLVNLWLQQKLLELTPT